MKLIIKLTLLFGDLLFWNAALSITLLLKYGFGAFYPQFQTHFLPFLILWFIWLLCFGAADLYQFHRFRAKREVWNRSWGAAAAGFLISVLSLYLFPQFFELTPKTNLLLVGFIFTLLVYGFRAAAWNMTRAGQRRIVFLGSSALTEELIIFLKNNPHLGYAVTGKFDLNDENWEEKIEELKANLIIVQPGISGRPANKLYRALAGGLAIMNFWDFYEMIMEKVPLSELQESWFLENIRTRKPAYDFAKRITDFILALIGGLILLPFGILIALLIKALTPGKIIYSQERTGLNNSSFILYKFRTMQENKDGPLWTVANDQRITGLGKILRRAHLDEIPQLWNVLRGDISLLGPRPERVELTKKFSEFSYYDMRHAVKPGITGWAQVSFQPSASMEEAKEKLAYDLYYIKNRSFVLDAAILIKTLRHLF